MNRQLAFIATRNDGNAIPGVQQYLPLSGIEDGVGNGAILSVMLMGDSPSGGGLLPLGFVLDSTASEEESTLGRLPTMARACVFDPVTGSFRRVLCLIDNVDNVPPEASGTNGILAALARLTGYDPVANEWNRLRLRPPGDQSGIGNDTDGVSLDTLARGAVWQGAQGWVFARAANIDTMNTVALSGVPLVTGAGEWSETNAPAAATAASASKAGDTINAHVCKSVSITLTCVAAQPPILFVLRDDATGAGNILRQWRLSGLAGTTVTVDLADLNVLGVPGNAMTLESTTAPAATNFAVVNISGVSVAD